MTQNQNQLVSRRYEVISIIKIVKWTFIPYLCIQFLHFLGALGKDPTNLLQATITFIGMSGWGYLVVGGPFVLIGMGVNYIVSQSLLMNIPQDTTLYEAVTQSTIMVGNLKVILPRIEDDIEILDENELEEW